MDEDINKLCSECGPISFEMFIFWKTLASHGKCVSFNDHDNNVIATKRLYKWLKEYKNIPDIVQHKKDNEKSKQFRFQGNDIFKTGKNLSSALELYNQSICWAEYGEELAIGFANRSAIYFEWAKYDICLENINLAIKAGYPQRLIEKLNQRKTICINVLQDMSNNAPIERNQERLNENISIDSDRTCFAGTEAQDFQMERCSFDLINKRDIPKLSLNANSTIPFIADCLILKTSLVQGRYIVTKNDLNPGQIISIEDSFVKALKKRFRYRKCSNCLKENYLNLIPCSTCTCTMFCSEKCLAEGQNYHKFECPIIDYIWEQCEEFALTLRLVIKAVTIFETVDELMKFREETASTKLKLSSCDNDIEKYNSINKLLTNEEKRGHLDMFIRCCKVAILYHFLIEKTDIAEIVQTRKHRDALMSLILQHSQLSSINALDCHQLHELNEEHYLNCDSVHVFAKGIYPFSSLFNHSCIPNTSTVTVGSKMVTYVTRPIKSNSQIFGCYKRIHHLLYPKVNRKENLSHDYHFFCKCEACEKDYPTFNSMLQGEFMLPEEVYLARSYNMDLSYDVDDIDKFCSILKRYDDQHSCSNLSRIGLRLHRAMTLKYGELSTDLEISLSENNDKLIAAFSLLSLSSSIDNN